MEKGRVWSGRWVAFGWVVLLAASFTAARELPRYIDSLDRRILYAYPDCTEIVADSMGVVDLTLEERQDSVMPWTRSCQDERQVEMVTHANQVTLWTTVVLGLMSLFTLAQTLAWGWERIRERME